MRKSGRAFAKNGYGAVICWFVLVMAVFAAVRILSSTSAGEKIESALREFIESKELAKAAIRFELGINPDEEDTIEDKQETEIYTDEEKTEFVYEDFEGESAVPEYYNNEEESAETVGLFDAEYLDPSVISIDNKTGLEIDVGELLNSPLGFTIEEDLPTVLIVHTHGSEAYMPTGEYTESDPYRTEDNAYNVVRVGSELKAELESYGISVIHDTTLHDYPSYNGSYNRSFETIAKYIESNPSIKLVIDLHRDAIANADGTQHRTVAQIGDEICSQLLLVMGTNASGLHHPAWQENLKLALKLQYAMNSLFPGLANPVKMSEYRYNQHMTSGSMILEVGCTGNTLEESVKAVKYFAAALNEVLETVT